MPSSQTELKINATVALGAWRPALVSCLLCILIVLPGAARAQIIPPDDRPDDPPEGDRRARLIEERIEKSRYLHPPEEPGSFEIAVRWIERQGFVQEGGGGSYDLFAFTPVVGGFRGSGTFTGGLRFEPVGPPESPFLAAAEARVSLRGYYGVSADLGYVPEPSPVVAYGYGQFWHMPDEDFFGIGPDTPEQTTSYGHDRGIAGGLLGFTPVTGVSVGGSASYETNALNGDDDFLEDGVMPPPGAGTHVDYYIFGGFAELDLRDVQRDEPLYEHFAPLRLRIGEMMYLAERGVYLSAEVLHYRPTTPGLPYQFTRLNIEAEQYIPIREGFQVVALREFTSLSFTDDDNAVPYYVMRTVGGSHTVRGFDTFRFRAPHLGVLNAEFRWRVWMFLDLALFMDAGYVFSDFDQLNSLSYGDLATGYGIGLRFHSGDQMLLQLDFAFSEEGPAVYLRLL